MSNKDVKDVAKKEVAQAAHEVKGELTYDDKVIQKIIGLSLEKVSGLLAVDGGFFSNLTDKLINTDNVTNGVNVEVGKEQVAVDLNVVVEYQKNVPALYDEIKKVVVEEVSKMTDLEVVEVNVNVVDIKTKEQHEADSVSLQDRVTDIAESTGEFASEQFEKAKSGLSGGFSAVQEKVGEGVEAVKDAASVEKTLGKIDKAISTVSTQRSSLGAVQNRLEHTIKNLNNAAENTQSAEARIRDTDMAKEMSTFTKNNVLSQAAQAMISQANQIPNQALQLLR